MSNVRPFPPAARRGDPPAGGTPRVVVVGAGFAGLAAVRALRRSGAQVTLVDARIYSTFQPLLYQVASGGLDPGDVAYSTRRFARRNAARFRRGRVTEVAEDSVRLDDGRRLGYDYLVLAAGVTTQHFATPGAQEHSLAPYTRQEAVELRDRLTGGLELLAAREGTDEVTVVIVGGGPTGVETAGALAELRDAGPRAGFPEIDPRRIRIALVERGHSLLGPYHPRLRRYALEQLQRRGVDVHLDTTIRELTRDSAVLHDGSRLRADVTVWAAGVAADERVAQWGLPQGKGGRIMVGPDLAVTGRSRIFAAGDLALDPSLPLPQLAAPAIQSGRHAGRQVARLIAGQRTRPFRYHDKGTMATIGRGAAIVELRGGIRLTGPAAWLSWMGLHIAMLLGNRNRMSTLLSLGWRYLARPSGGAVVVGEVPEDVVSAPSSTVRTDGACCRDGDETSVG